MASGNPIAHLQAQLRAFEGGFRSWLAAQPLAYGISREHLQLQYEVSQGEVRRVRSWLAAKPLAYGISREHLQLQYEVFQDEVRRVWFWLEAQPAAVKVSVVTVTTALQGAAIGVLMCEFNAYNIIQALPFGTAFSRQVQAFAGRPLVVQACNFAVMAGMYACIECMVKRDRGVDDILNSMVAALGSGTIFLLFSSRGSVPEKVGSAIILGGSLAICKHQFRPLEDAKYSKVKRMLTSLDLEEYGRYFRNADLTDEILPLITESTLHAIKIPPRYAVQIVAHIQRDSECVGKRKR